MFKTIILLVAFYAGCFGMGFGFTYLAWFAIAKVKERIAWKKLEKRIACDPRTDMWRQYYSREKL